MIKTQLGSSEFVIRILSNELDSYEEETKVLLPRSIVCSEIVRLQNQSENTATNQRKLLLLVSNFHAQKTRNSYKKRFVQMKAKTVSECFNETIVPVYINR